MSSWQLRKIGEVCEIVNGGTPKTNISRFWDGNILWITPKDLGKLEDIYVVDTERKISKAGLIESSANIIPPHSIILSTRAPIGYLAINKKEISTNQGCKGLIPNNHLDTNFLYYFLKDSVDLLNSLGSGTTFKELSGKKLKEIVIPFPPLPEQKRIVKVLDEIFENVEKAKENAEKNLRNSKQLFESYLHGVFANPGKDWEERRLEDVCEISSKLVDPRQKEFLNLVHIGAGNIETKSEKLVGLKTAKEEKLISGKFLFDNRMVLYSKIRPYLMKVVRPDFNGLCSADIYPLLPNRKLLNRDFLFYLLLTVEFTRYAILGSGRAGMPKVNRQHLFAFIFSLPDLSEQKAIVEKLDTLSFETKKLEGIYKQKLADLEELKKSVLKKAFAGEL